MKTTVSPRFYIEPPWFDIPLDDFEALPKRRLEAFRLLRAGYRNISAEMKEVDDRSPGQDARSMLVHGHATGNSFPEARDRRADVASHFILRLACCGRDGRSHAPDGKQTEDSERALVRREWFVGAEKKMFEARLRWHLHHDSVGDSGGDDTTVGGEKEDIELQSLSEDRKRQQREQEQQRRVQDKRVNDRCEALRVVYELGWIQPVGRRSAGLGGKSSVGKERDGESRESISTADGASRHDGAGSTTNSSTKGNEVGAAGQNFNGYKYFSCPFDKALPLVKSRRVLLEDGMALLEPSQIPLVVMLHFENVLRNDLSTTARGLPGVEADERVRHMLVQVRNAVDVLVGGNSPTSSATGGRPSVKIRRDNIDAVADKHFPLCMRRAVRVLRREHHLKYQARLQLVSFLANAGMEVGELIALWREEFPKGMSKDEYVKKINGYEYSIRHVYGLEGKRRVYTPMSCSKIASLGYGSGDGGAGHGCPFVGSQRQRAMFDNKSIDGFGSAGKSVGGKKRSHNGAERCSDTCGGNSHITRSGKDETLHDMLSDLKLPIADIEDIVKPLSRSGSGAQGSGGGGGACVACDKHFSVMHRFLRHGGAGVYARGWGGDGQKAFPNGWHAASAHLHSSMHPEPVMPQAFMRQEG